MTKRLEPALSAEDWARVTQDSNGSDVIAFPPPAPEGHVEWRLKAHPLNAAKLIALGEPCVAR